MNAVQNRMNTPSMQGQGAADASQQKVSQRPADMPKITSAPVAGTPQPQAGGGVVEKLLSALQSLVAALQGLMAGGGADGPADAGPGTKGAGGVGDQPGAAPGGGEAPGSVPREQKGKPEAGAGHAESDGAEVRGVFLPKVPMTPEQQKQALMETLKTGRSDLGDLYLAPVKKGGDQGTPHMTQAQQRQVLLKELQNGRASADVDQVSVVPTRKSVGPGVPDVRSTGIGFHATVKSTDERAAKHESSGSSVAGGAVVVGIMAAQASKE